MSNFQHFVPAWRLKHRPAIKHANRVMLKAFGVNGDVPLAIARQAIGNWMQPTPAHDSYRDERKWTAIAAPANDNLVLEKHRRAG